MIGSFDSKLLSPASGFRKKINTRQKLYSSTTTLMRVGQRILLQLTHDSASEYAC